MTQTISVTKAVLADRKRCHAIIATGNRLGLHSDTVNQAILSGVSAEGFTKTFEVEALARLIASR